MNFNKLLALLLTLAIMQITSCKKDDSTSIEMVRGKWQLLSIQGTDSFMNSSINNQNNWKSITNFSYEKNPLTITYDTITSQGTKHKEYQYNFNCQFEFLKDGTLTITEDYCDISNNPIFSVVRKTSWHKDPFAMNPNTFYLWTYEGYEPYSPNNSKVFTHPYDPIYFNDEAISENYLTLKFKDEDHGLWEIIYKFKKI